MVADSGLLAEGLLQELAWWAQHSIFYNINSSGSKVYILGLADVKERGMDWLLHPVP